MHIARFFPVLLALAVTGCGGCVESGDSNGTGANANTGTKAASNADPAAAGSGAKILDRPTHVPPSFHIIQGMTLVDGGPAPASTLAPPLR